MDALINWWLIGSAAILSGQYWYELSVSKFQSVFVGFVAGMVAASALDLAGWL